RIAAAIDATTTRRRSAPPSAGPLVQRGKDLLLAGRAPEALPILEEAVSTEPYSAEAQYQLARAFRATGDHFRAMTAFEHAVELRPAHLSALRALAALYEEKGFRRKATETLERALSVATDDPTRGAIREDLLALLG
ncbi:MAG TPA: tetratricopeptide repeat protein, partial [Anaeromyxobacteraceae bacterium]|nr:tetratricopeptide repeat protein [Anaeromyxobacteraceae bacterium]